MKKYAAFILVLLATVSVYASVRIINASNTDLGSFSKVRCGSGIACAPAAGGVMLIGEAGGLENQVASTTVSITAAQCGSTFVSNSADVMTLPEASTVLGCRLTFICGTADDFDVNPADGTDVIGPISVAAASAVTTITPSAGDAVRCTDIGSSFVIEAIGADRWAAVGPGHGPITDVN
jgi:hypothetical protein